jgi:hypothetical protein
MTMSKTSDWCNVFLFCLDGRNASDGRSLHNFGYKRCCISLVLFFFFFLVVLLFLSKYVVK